MEKIKIKIKKPHTNPKKFPNSTKKERNPHLPSPMATKTFTHRDCPLSVSIASQNLPPTEALLQTFNSLENLTQNVSEVFNRLNSRITEERTKLQNIQERIKQCDAKVRYVATKPNDVCTIYSAATFPSKNAPQLFNRIVGDTDENLPNPISMTNYKLSEQQRFRVSEKANTNDIFMKLTRATLTRNDRTFRNDSGKEGLGRFPLNLESTSAVILFNSDENPYKNYESFNNLDSVADVRQKVKKDKSLAAAPTTIASGLELPGFQSLQFDYRPDLGVLPTFALPTQLDLKNVANINFDSQSMLASIAPSLTAAIDLPSFGLAQQSMQQNAKKTKQSTSAPPPAAVAPPPAAIAPPAAVQPPQQQATQQTATTAVQAPVQAPAAVAPQPSVSTLPPTPQVAPATTTPAAPKKPLQAQAPSLMDSIRQGLKLKKIDDPNNSAPAQKPKPTSGAESLQSALFAGIQRHAALMNGKGDPKNNEGKQADGGLGKSFNSSIQKRLMAQESESESESDDDWVN